MSASLQKLIFSDMEWEKSESRGIRSKTFEQNGQKIRLLELTMDLEHSNWCLKGHIGYVIEGHLEIIFTHETIRYNPGDAFLIEAGEKYKHIPKPLSAKVLLFMVEESVPANNENS